ncbi:Glycosyl transferase, group 1 [Cupriavidus phytorum]|uniref:Glycosyl transferase, group 1 n=2 Tax=Cupriavidus TaxID=106589 RepID=A0A375BZ04_9BURK|nr:MULTISPECIES: glycosyltransferase [Cupriavidus]PZX29401.1 glycosyltransferase involved in cell wall biosynthesis [Cupriavidus alkaliphilus]SOY58950.1 Glycosyl transferase, group 1 [Cupriavidus taiwanensis]
MGSVDDTAAPAPLRILVITTGLKLGGAEQQIAALARAFLALGNEVAVLSLTQGHEIDLPAAIPVTELDMRKTPLSMLAAQRKARLLVRQWRPDVIHAHMVHANLFARVLARTGRMPPVICSAHSAREGGRLRALAYRVTDRWCALTTHVSDAGRMAMVASGAVPDERVIVMPNGIDTSRFHPDQASREQARRDLGLGPDDVLVLNVGRLVPEKDQAMLIEAFAEVCRDLPKTRLMIAGDGPLRDELAQQVARHGLNHVVLLAGARSDIPELLRAADVFVLSSRIEGMPLVVGEALASGLPVVATAAAGVSELAGDTATLTPTGNPQALASALRNAIAALPGTETERDRRRQRIVGHFDVNGVARQWLAHYRSLRKQP